MNHPKAVEFWENRCLIYYRTIDNYTEDYSFRTRNYSIDYLQICRHAANEIWYLLDGKYEKHTKGQIEFSMIAESDVMKRVEKIRPEHKTGKFNRKLIASIAADFEAKYIPRYIILKEYQSQGLPESINKLIITMGVVLISGLILPLILQTFNFGDLFTRIAATILVFVVVNGLSFFIVDYYQILNREINLKE